MISIDTGENIEIRHFMNDELQITIGIDRNLWPSIQCMANQMANDEQWLNGFGREWDYLNIWILRRLAQRPKGVVAHYWISLAAK